MPLTTTVTWDDLLTRYDDEIAEIETAYSELQERATGEYGNDWAEQSVSVNDPELLDDDERALLIYQRELQALNQSYNAIQKRYSAIERCREQYGDGDFEIKMLSAGETMDIETKLRVEAKTTEGDRDTVSHLRDLYTCEQAVIDAPEGVATNDDGTPDLSAEPNPLVLTLYEFVQDFNSSGSVDFTSEGLGTEADTALGDTPGDLPTSAMPSPSSATDAE